MEHFSVVQSLCRIGLEAGDERFRKQVQRLLERLRKAGEVDHADALKTLLTTTTETTSLAPSRVEVSRSLVSGDELTANVHPPADRETSVPLAEILMAPAEGQPAPLFNETLRLAMTALVAEWQQSDALSALGVEPSRSCLFYGPPGTGKTLAALTLAAQLQLPVVSARIDGLVSSFLGTTARNIANLFDFANRYRCVLLLDEFDALAKMRDDPHELGELKRVVNTLLQNLDARANRGLTIAITNHEGLLDPAVWRRFQNHLRIESPDWQTRLEMFESFLGSLELSSDALKTLAFIAGPKTGSELKTFTDALRRNLALAGAAPAPQSTVTAARSIIPRFGLTEDKNSPAYLLLNDLPSFVGSILHADLGIRQESLAQMLDCSQSKISRWSSDWEVKNKTLSESLDVE